MKKAFHYTLMLIFIHSYAKAQHTAVSFDKMNVVYLNSSNPLSIVAEKTNSKDLIITTDNGKISGEVPYYYFEPERAGKAIITVSVKTKDGVKKVKELNYRVKCPSAPQVLVGGLPGGEISAALLCAQIKPTVNTEGYEPQYNGEIVSCKITVAQDEEIIYEKELNDPHGVKFDEGTRTVWSFLKRGATISLTDFICEGPGCKCGRLKDLKFTIE